MLGERVTSLSIIQGYRALQASVQQEVLRTHDEPLKEEVNPSHDDHLWHHHDHLRFHSGHHAVHGRRVRKRIWGRRIFALLWGTVLQERPLSKRF